ncbi:hypothetical protein [Burkholderia pseudomallei]|uniref:hypothetical protein n=1 Tax=Burkholderia pseudomallei TaxID=28450 RepID=UPI0011C21D06|nr:hypothetical protein [Burkholderia pseudomallei]
MPWGILKSLERKAFQTARRNRCMTACKGRCETGWRTSLWQRGSSQRYKRFAPNLLVREKADEVRKVIV